MLERHTGFWKLDVERAELDLKEDFCYQDPRCDVLTNLLRLCLVVCVLNSYANEAVLATKAVRGEFKGEVGIISRSPECSLSGSWRWSLAKVAA